MSPCPICDEPMRNITHYSDGHVEVSNNVCMQGHYARFDYQGGAAIEVESVRFMFCDDWSNEERRQVKRDAEWAAKAASIAYRLSELKGCAA